MVRASSSRSDDEVSLDAEQEATLATTHDAISSSVVLQRRGGVPSQWDQFTRKYEAQ